MNDYDHLPDDLLSAASSDDDRQRLAELWNDLGLLPAEDPPQGIVGRFSWRLRARPLTAQRTGAPWGTIAAGFIVGLLTGATVTSMVWSRAPSTDEAGLRSAAISASLPHRSSAQRLAAIHILGDLTRSDAEARSALVERALNDPTPAVQLAAIDHLAHLELSPAEADSLARALQRIGSPIVQVALLDLLTTRDDPVVAAAVNQLFQDRSADALVRRHAGRALSRMTERTTT